MYDYPARRTPQITDLFILDGLGNCDTVIGTVAAIFQTYPSCNAAAVPWQSTAIARVSTAARNIRTPLLVDAQPSKLANIANCDNSHPAESQGFETVDGRCWAAED
jgi:hypothetical protein